MKIKSIKLWRFQCFGPRDAARDSDKTPTPLVMRLDDEITAMIGRNGSGKSALLAAFVRLFGETREERDVKPEDFFVPPGETLESVPLRQFYIEVEFSFPELEAKAKEAEKTVPSAFRNMVIDGPGGTMSARVRLEATYQTTGSLDGSIEDNVYWITTLDEVPFGDVNDPTIKRKMSAGDRSHVAVRFIPASRDVTSLTKLTVRSLGRSLMQSVEWKNKAKIKALLDEAGEALFAEDALKLVNNSISNCWNELNTADTATNAQLHVLPPDFQQVVKAASIVLNPSAVGRTMSVEDLSDGQRSLFHFALVKALLDLKLGLEADVADGKKPPFSATFMRAPALTIFAFEEPENHLAPFFLSKLITELQNLSKTQRVQGLLTSHSPAIVGRLNPEALRHVRRDSKTGVSYAAALILPPETDEAAKFVREAVRAHPELYFARHAIFGEGASEEIVLPKIAEALGMPIDRSFVAMVPVGGRYIQHFWRLVTQLGIPHTTLLDFDLGRSSGDISQLKAAAQAVLEFKPPTDPMVEKNLKDAVARTRKDWASDGWTSANLELWAIYLEQQDVFFSFRLDLDMLMLEAFPTQYQKLPAGAKGPQNPEEAERQKTAAERVLKSDGYGVAAYGDYDKMSLFPWYAYLFLGNRGKPAVHLSALSQISDADLAAGSPDVLKRLLKRVSEQLELGAA